MDMCYGMVSFLDFLPLLSRLRTRKLPVFLPVDETEGERMRIAVLSSASSVPRQSSSQTAWTRTRHQPHSRQCVRLGCGCRTEVRTATSFMRVSENETARVWRRLPSCEEDCVWFSFRMYERRRLSKGFRGFVFSCKLVLVCGCVRDTVSIFERVYVCWYMCLCMCACVWL